MPFNWQTFKTRTLTAAVFVVVMLIGLLWNSWSFFILFSIIHFGCWWEYLKLIEKINQKEMPRLLKIGLIVLGYTILVWFFSDQIEYFLFKLFGTRDIDILFYSMLFSVLSLPITLIGLGKYRELNPKWWVAPVAGIIYISLSLGLILALYRFTVMSFENHLPTTIIEWDGVPPKINNVSRIPIMIIFCLWINDTMAYIIGSLIGKTPLSKISPKKTWEGTIGGVTLTLVITILAASLMNLNILHVTFVAAIVCIAGTFGDLFESKLKRMAGVKDSGHIMPGHGGFLDRFDSLLFAIPFVWLYVFFFLK